MPKTQETVLELDLEALAFNFKFIKSKLNPNTKMLAVVKAFAYGTDAGHIAKKLEQLNVDYFAVAYTHEGVLLRDQGIKTPILVLHPQPVNFKLLIDKCLEPNLYNMRVLKLFLALAQKMEQKAYPVHLKFNTGLNRLGFRHKDLDSIVEKLIKAPQIKVKSIFSHLAASEDINERPFTLQQISAFDEIANKFIKKIGFKPMLHQSNTSAIFKYPEAHFDMVRCGIGLFGFGNEATIDKALKPVAALKSVISQIHLIEPDESVGYNRAFKAQKFCKTATVPIGHADGIYRSLGNGKGQLKIKGKMAPIVGNVCMDMLMVDISEIDCKEGDEVIIFDDQGSVHRLADQANTISYEILTAISQRVKRFVK